MARSKKLYSYLEGFFSGVIFSFITMVFTMAQANSIKLKDMSVALWIFITIGAIVVLLQLIPALLLFITFIAGVYKKKGE